MESKEFNQELNLSDPKVRLVLQKINALEKLNLSDKSFNIKHICAAIKSGQCTDCLIDVSSNHLDKHMVKELFEAMQSGDCRGINLSGCSLDDASLEIIVEALKKCPSGFIVDLSDNNIDVSGADIIAKGLTSKEFPEGLHMGLARSLKSLKAVEIIFEALGSGRCPRYLSLDLSYNNTGVKGMRAFEKALKTGHCSEGLAIKWQGNIQSSHEALIFVRILHSNTCPYGLSIDISSNFIGDSEITALYNALKLGHIPAGFSLIMDEKHKKIPELITNHNKNKIMEMMYALYLGMPDTINIPVSLMGSMVEYIVFQADNPRTRQDQGRSKKFGLFDKVNFGKWVLLIDDLKRDCKEIADIQGSPERLDLTFTDTKAADEWVASIHNVETRQSGKVISIVGKNDVTQLAEFYLKHSQSGPNTKS